MDYSYKEIHEAYIKLKTYIYYDSTNLFMRKQLAIFETNLADSPAVFPRMQEYKYFKKKYKIENLENEVIYEEKLRVFTEALNSYGDDNEYFQKMLERIEAKFLPKKIENERRNSNIITNKRTAREYRIERSTIFIDAPIEIHLISVLWILKRGASLDSMLSSECHGNRLILNKEKTAVVQGSGLFKPYPKQYQKWRDGAVTAAKEHLDRNENVLIVNLDIRDFFYSVRIPKDEIIRGKNSKRKKRNIPSDNLFDIFGIIHEIFTRKLIDYKAPYDLANEVMDSEGNLEKYILPIGLLSSFVLANEHLLDFDKRIVKYSRPVYYGRYVDDILLVISSPITPEDQDEVIQELNFDYVEHIELIRAKDNEHISESNFDKLLDVEQYVLLNFKSLISLIDKPHFLYPTINNIDEDRVFKLNGYDRLYCQSDKTLLYYFDKDESALVIEKLKRDLEEKSSEFRNYTDADDAEDFEESAYHLLYDGTEGKIKTLKDYKEDKFGLTVYLSKRIFNSLRTADKISDIEARKIVQFFQGLNALSLYTLWERIFVFLLVNDKPDAYVEFYLNCCEAIKRISLDHSKTVVSQDRYQSHVLEHLDSANELALSLYPKFLSQVQKVKRTYKFSFNALKNDLEFYRAKYNPTDEESHYISRYRKSNLVRHHYVAQPLLSYTETYKNKDFKNFTDIKISF